MKLSLQQIKGITRGAVNVTEEDGYFRFYRFTEAQAQSYLDNGRPDFFVKTKSTAGVRFFFCTDSKRFSFEYLREKGSSRQFAWFDLYVNGALTGHFGCAGSDTSLGSADFDLGDGEKTVEIYFPWSAKISVRNVTLDDGATVTGLSRPRSMLVYGDSITHGYDAIYPSFSYASQIARLLDAEAINKAIGGDKFHPYILCEKDSVSPDFITVAYGTNDWSGGNLEVFNRDCRDFFQTLADQYPTAKIFAVTPIWRADWAKETGFGFTADHLFDTIRDLTADIPNVIPLRTWNYLPHLPEFFSDLRLHPNDAGFALYAMNLYQDIINN